MEIIAKKLWHRGDRITGRDIFGFALIAEREPEVLMQAREFMTRHAAAVFLQLEERSVQLKQQFEAVYVLNFHPTFDQASDTLKSKLLAMLEAPVLGSDSRSFAKPGLTRCATTSLRCFQIRGHWRARCRSSGRRSPMRLKNSVSTKLKLPPFAMEQLKLITVSGCVSMPAKMTIKSCCDC